MKQNKELEKLIAFFKNEDKNRKFNYIKEPYSANGILSFVIGLIVFAATAVLLAISVFSNGEIAIELASVGISAILLSFAGIMFLYISIGEKNRKHRLSWIGGLLSLITAVVWTVLLTL